MRRWRDLDGDEQLRLRLDYQAHLDAQPRTCSMDEKIVRFTEWLDAREISFSTEDLSRKTPR